MKKKILFYCQYHLGMGHLVRSLEILRSLAKDFQVCFVKAGWEVEGFEAPAGVQVVTLPLLLSENRQVKVADSSQDLEEVKQVRQDKLLQVFEEFQPDCLITEGYPFNKHQFEFEAIPLLQRIKATGRKTKVVSSLRDIVMAKHYDNREAVTDKICNLMNQYFDLLLVHSDPKFHNLAESFPRIKEIQSQIKYTGYVAQSSPENPLLTEEDLATLNLNQPTILVTIGGGQLGHDLLESILQAIPLISKSLPHQIIAFAGPFFPAEKFLKLQETVANQTNLTLRKYTANLIPYMEKAELSISLCGYNTTMNILRTGVNSMIFPSNKDWEQKIRAEKLEKLGLTEIIHPADLNPESLSQKIIANLNKQGSVNTCEPIELEGAQKTSSLLQEFLENAVVAV
ncbi:glycosyltransferase [Mastigocoleus sp. MO_188.B34]|uniref:glycosyltransferase family protein n=1 Tax=Mastigocoleus sp. MO_188.B34 TaxID=3036635 RepID=UPI0026214854|nr:glycosyltransferase [Mastigocoleus sp. MO_188.B34]MDJ0693527.1 glycosyltransferase [Mastigocoleus sp. MO_188.B34]